MYIRHMYFNWKNIDIYKNNMICLILICLYNFRGEEIFTFVLFKMI